MAKYLKTYMGVISGSMAGRDDGYPEEKRVYYNDLAKLIADHGKHPEEKYYVLTEMPEDMFKQAYEQHKTDAQRKKEEAERAADLAELDRLKKKLKVN
jgi:hypothetical protein